MLEHSGVELGKALLNRHNLIERFLTLLNIKDGLLDSTEKMEHTMSNEILIGIQDLIDFFYDDPEMLNKFLTYRGKKNNEQI